MNGWYPYLPLWAKLYWRTSVGNARIRLPWPTWVRWAGARAWVRAYKAWKRDGYPE